jgi:hypothetical protein
LQVFRFRRAGLSCDSVAARQDKNKKQKCDPIYCRWPDSPKRSVFPETPMAEQLKG